MLNSNNWYCSSTTCPLKTKCRRNKIFAPALVTDFRDIKYTIKNGKVICEYKKL